MCFLKCILFYNLPFSPTAEHTSVGADACSTAPPAYRCGPQDGIDSWCNQHLTLSVLQSIAALVTVSEGDLRKAITFLQSAARLNMDREITESAIIELAGVSLKERRI